MPIAKTSAPIKGGYHRMSLIVPPKLHWQFKLATAAQGREMTEVLLEFIQEYVDKHLPAAFRQKNSGGRK